MSGSNALLDAIAHPPQVDVAGAYGNANRLAAGIWANREMQAKQAAGNVFLRSLNPDGTPNQPALNQGLAADPTTALAAQDASQKGQTLSADQYTQQMKRLTYGAAGFGQILVDNGGQAPYAAVKQYYDRAVTDGHITADDEAKVMAGFGPDPSANASVGRQRMMQNITAQEALARGNGITGSQTGPGGVTTGTLQNSQTGAVSSPPQQGAPLGLSPGEMAAETPIYKKMPDGTYQPVLDPRSNRPGVPGARVAPNYNGQPNPLLGDIPNPQDGNTPPAASPALTAPPQGQPERVAADVGKFKQDQFAIPGGQQNVQSLQKAQVALEASNTGRSSEGVHNMLATMQTLGIPTLGMADSVASYDLAHKYLLDYARKSGAAAHSDLQLQSSEGANASTGINQQAALDVVHTNIGRERQAIAQNMEAPQTGIGYGAHTSKFATATDPRGFALDAYKPADLNPDDPKSMVGKMTPAERAKFYKSAGIAQRLGLLNTRAP
jgi:hypothetical protein